MPVIKKIGNRRGDARTRRRRDDSHKVLTQAQQAEMRRKMGLPPKGQERRRHERNPIQASRRLRNASNALTETSIDFWTAGPKAKVRLKTGAKLMGAAYKVALANRLTKRMMMFDPKFDVLNDRAFNEMLFRTMRVAKPASRFSFAVIDIDLLRDLNTRRGHEGGDQALDLIVKTFNRMLGGQKASAFGRFGGDEFKFFAPVSGRVLKKALEAVQERLTDIDPDVHFSAGVVDSKDLDWTTHTARKNLHVETAQDLIKQMNRDADEACYVSKNRGRQKVTLFTKPVL